MSATTSTSLSSEALLDQWPALTEQERVQAFEQLPRAETDDFFLNLPAFDQAHLLLALPPGERRLWMRLLAPDDAADLLQNVPKRNVTISCHSSTIRPGRKCGRCWRIRRTMPAA